jgi:hypothetical protein
MFQINYIYLKIWEIFDQEKIELKNDQNGGGIFKKPDSNNWTTGKQRLEISKT